MPAAAALTPDVVAGLAGTEVRKFGHAFWFSFQTASTIGYSGDMYPDPDWRVAAVLCPRMP